MKPRPTFVQFHDLNIRSPSLATRLRYVMMQDFMLLARCELMTDHEFFTALQRKIDTWKDIEQA